MIDEFPGNSHKALQPPGKNEEPKPADKKIDPIDTKILGKVTRRKKSLGRRFVETFFTSDSKSVGGYLMRDVLIPALQNLVIDAVTQGFEKAVYGDVRTVRNRSGFNQNRTHISYDRPTTIRQTSATGPMSSPNRHTPQRRSSSEVQDIVMESRAAAEMVLERLFEALEKYGAVSQADLNSLIGQTSVYTDQIWGWTDLAGSDIRRISGGWLIVLPNPEDLRQ